VPCLRDNFHERTTEDFAQFDGEAETNIEGGLRFDALDVLLGDPDGVAVEPTCCVTVCTSHYIRVQMTTTLSVRIDSDTKDQLEALAKRSRRSKSFLAAEAIAAYVEAEAWQLDEIQAGLQELDSGRAVAHGDVSKWLRSWGKKRERKAPRA
jgi:predicted transcriptional regulator